MRAALFLVLLAGCKDPEPEPVVPCAPAALPTIDLDAIAGIRQESGTYQVAWDGSDRELDLHIWYPTTDTDGDAAEYIGIFEDELSLVDATYAEADSTCQHPLVVYSHGSQAWAGGGSPLIRQFVKEGWVAIGPDHLGNTLNDNLDPRPKTFSLSRVHDVRFAIDYIESLPEGDPLHGRVDTSRVLVMGHSFGGQTSWLVGGPSFDPVAVEARCGTECTVDELAAFDENPGDERVVAVMPLAGSVGDDLVSAAGFADLSVPTLYMTGSADFDGQPSFERASQTPDLSWVEIEGACHESFTATVLPCDGITKEDSLTIVATYATALGTKHVLGAEDSEINGILDGSVVVSDAATLTP